MDHELDAALAVINAWTARHTLIDAALQHCRRALANCVEEDIDAGITPLHGLQLDELKLHFSAISLVSTNAQLPYPYFSTSVGLFVDDPLPGTSKPGGEVQIGSYRLITGLDGTVIDDYLVLYWRIRDIVKETYNELAFQFKTPFVASCAAARASSPLEPGEQVEVLRMAAPEECVYEMFVVARWRGREVVVPLAQLEFVSGTKRVQRGLAYWRYYDKRYVDR